MHALTGLAPVLLLGLAAFVAQDKQVPPQKGVDLSKVVAIVDMNRVVTDYPWKTQATELLDKRVSELAVPYQTAMKQLRAEQAEAAAAAEGSRKRMAHEAQIEILGYQAKVLKEVLMQDRNELQQKIFTDIYREIRTATRDLAARKGLLLVLRSRESDPGMSGMETLENREREVLYFDKTLDITGDVIEYLKATPPPRPTLDAPKEPEKPAEAGKTPPAKADSGKSDSPAANPAPPKAAPDKK